MEIPTPVSPHPALSPRRGNRIVGTLINRGLRLRHGDPATPERIAEWLRMCLQAWRDGKCDGVVTYCLDKTPASRTFGPARKLFQEFGQIRKAGEPSPRPR